MFYDKFTNLYPIQKTLRFELKPVNETFDYIEELKSQYLKDVIEEDKKRADCYQELKPLMDDCHRNFIDKSLNLINKDEFKADLKHAFSVYRKIREASDQEWPRIQKKLRKKIAGCFNNQKGIDPKNIIKEILPKMLKEDKKLDKHEECLENFKKFFGYFRGFKENRKNMYSDDDKATSIANRLINENLIYFFDNCITFEKINSKQINFDIAPEIKEKLDIKNVKEAFNPEFFVNLLTQKGIDPYRELIGGYTEESRKQYQGLNEQINLFIQNHKIRLPLFKSLYKQILSDRETTSFILKDFQNDKELISELKQFNERIDHSLSGIKRLIDKIETYNLEGIFIKKDDLNNLSSQIFNNDYEFIKRALIYSDENKKEKVFTLKCIEESLLKYSQTLDNEEKSIKGNEIINYFKKEFTITLKHRDEFLDKVSKDIYHLNSIGKRRAEPNSQGDKSQWDDGYKQIFYIKKLMDSYLSIKSILKPMHLVKDRKKMNVPNIDISFYEEFKKNYKIFDEDLVPLYSKIRNYLTKKAFLVKKIKINFKNSTFLNGWDRNKESDYSCVLLERNGLYYLGALHHKHKNIFEYQNNESFKKKIIDPEKQGYRKMIYKLLPRPNNMLMKVFFAKSNKSIFKPSDEISRIRNHATHSKNGNPQNGYEKRPFEIKDCRRMIDFFKESIKKRADWKNFGFTFSPTEEYNGIEEFYKEVKDQGYSLKFDHIKQKYVDECVSEGKLFLFQIYSKDFSKSSKGFPNLHTLYWKGVFEKENLQDTVIKLDGKAEMFFRKHSIRKNERIVHTKNKKIINKQNKKESIFEYDLIKDKRYTKDKFFLHIPITLNFKEENRININNKVNQEIIKDNVKYIIGIDRGERNLIYYTVIDIEGSIIEQGSWNKLDTIENCSVDYHKELSKREKERDRARKSWSKIEDIKSLKKGYLSQVIHKLTDLMVKYNAIVCLENLNFGFKRGRMKFEKQVYQNFEKSLINKLNYFVQKQAKINKPGHYLRAYQLTSPFVSFEKLRRQSGTLYYLPSYYTSIIDPETGFINFIKLKYENKEKIKNFFNSFEKIYFSKENNYFNFYFNYKNMDKENIRIKGDIKLIQYQSDWTVSSFGNRYIYNRKEKRYDDVDLTKNLKEFFDKYGIDYKSGEDIKSIIISQTDAAFFKEIVRLFNAILKIRNSISTFHAEEKNIPEKDRDFILSPVANDNGEFFDSRKSNDKKPKDADANGAYHIALKGLLLIDKIKNKDDRLNIENKEWFEFINKIVKNKKTEQLKGTA